MLAIERRRSIMSRLNTEGKVIVAELAKEFDVTEETIRRDLDKLEKEGLASKTYGGAVLNQKEPLDLPYNVREVANVDEKKLIAEKFSELIQDGDRLMLDSSSTAQYIVKVLKEKKDLTIITNSVKILLELADKNDWTILSTGGVLKNGALSLNGSSAEKMIGSYYVDAAICSCKGIDTELGITESNENDTLIKRAMFASAEKKILALDSKKFDRKSFVKVCCADEIDIIVTDKAPSEKWRGFCEKQNIKLIY